MIFVALGWLATTAYLIGHLYLAVKPDFQARIYYGLNLFGGVGFVISSAAIASWQSVIINVFWALISLAALKGEMNLPQFKASRWWLIGPAFLAAIIGLLYLSINYALGSNIMGWAGTAIYVLGYYLFTVKAVKSWQFLTYNTIAAIILLPVYALDDNWPAFALSAIWSLISLYGLWNIRETIRQTNASN